ncbi:hypothetical protein AB0M52_31425, partial [Micromonospora sp. NPDC051296]
MTATKSGSEAAAPTVRPVRWGWVVLTAVAAGVLLSVLWSYEFVDHTIGDSMANAILGRDAKATAIGGTAAALV